MLVLLLMQAYRFPYNEEGSNIVSLLTTLYRVGSKNKRCILSVLQMINNHNVDIYREISGNVVDYHEFNDILIILLDQQIETEIRRENTLYIQN